jgi:hypothetical protein
VAKLPISLSSSSINAVAAVVDSLAGGGSSRSNAGANAPVAVVDLELYPLVLRVTGVDAQGLPEWGREGEVLFR